MSKRPIHIPEAELSWRFSRSSGPGGQHVNTSDTRAEVIWNLIDTTVLTEAQKERVAARLRGRLVDGALTVVSSEYRSQHRNREAARVRLEELVSEAATPVKARVATKPSKASQRRRLDAKRARADVKRNRGRVTEN